MQRIAKLAGAEANIDRFCHQSGRLAFPTKGDVSQLHMKRGGEIVLHLIEGDLPAGAIAEPGAGLAGAPVGLQQEPRANNDEQQSD